VAGIFTGDSSRGAVQLDERNPTLTPTFIDASGFPEPNHAVVMDTITDTTLDGFIVTGGAATGPEENIQNAGGGILCTGLDNSNLISSCTVTGNMAARHGAGIYLNASNVRVIGCTIEDNQSVDQNASAAGITIAAASEPSLELCTIIDNAGFNFGGGISVFAGSKPVVCNCMITSNSATRGAGIYSFGGETGMFTHCHIMGNRAERGGGGYITGLAETFVDFEIAGNVANWESEFGGFGVGGGMYITGGATPQFFECEITGNSALDNAGDGSGVRATLHQNLRIVFSRIIWPAETGAGSSSAARRAHQLFANA
jgi:parallel beta-helix repeat protein